MYFFNKNRTFGRAFLVSLASFALACGPGPGEEKAFETKESDKTALDFGEALEGEATNLLDQTAIGVGVRSDRKGFGLVSVSDWSVTIDNCASGFTTIVDSANPSASLYKFDQNCVGKLDSFMFGSNLYTPSPTQNYQDYAEGEYAVFVNTINTSDYYYVRIESQLSSPLESGDDITFKIISAQANINVHSLLTLIRGTTQEITFKTNAMPWLVTESEIVGEDGVSESLYIAFKFECFFSMKDTNSLNRAYCKARDNPLRNMTYVLVPNNTGAEVCYTRSQCASFFDGSETAIDMTTDYYPPGAVMANGGFTTKIDASEALLGPANIAVNNTMTVILNINGDYATFNFTLETEKNF